RGLFVCEEVCCAQPVVDSVEKDNVWDGRQLAKGVHASFLQTRHDPAAIDRVNAAISDTARRPLPNGLDQCFPAFEAEEFGVCKTSWWRRCRRGDEHCSDGNRAGKVASAALVHTDDGSRAAELLLELIEYVLFKFGRCKPAHEDGTSSNTAE